MTIEQYLADVCFCYVCGQGLRENFEIVVSNDAAWHIRCIRCNRTFTIYKEQLDKVAA